jgi:hypothetical protein
MNTSLVGAKVADIVGIVMGALLVGVILCFLFAFVTQIAWDHSFGQIFNLPHMTYWQAFWLNFLGSIVVKNNTSTSTK